MSEPTIWLNGLVKRFHSITAVDGISMIVRSGEIFGFLGANGAGKTTTIRMLCGLTRPTAGTGLIHGLDVWRDRFRARSTYGYVPQHFSLYADLTVYENLRFFGGAYRVPKGKLRHRIDRLLSEFDLSPQKDILAGSLSGGFKQLLSIACALIHRPSLVFLDEPTAGLDPVHRQYIWDLLYELSEEGTTIFVTTHYMDEAERCTDVGFIQGGRLLAKGSQMDLKNRLRGKLLEVHVEPVMEAIPVLRAVPGIYGVELRSGRLRLQARDSEMLLRGWEKHWPYPHLCWMGHEWVDPDMEDVFMAYSLGTYEAESVPDELETAS